MNETSYLYHEHRKTVRQNAANTRGSHLPICFLKLRGPSVTGSSEATNQAIELCIEDAEDARRCLPARLSSLMTG